MHLEEAFDPKTGMPSWSNGSVLFGAYHSRALVTSPDGEGRGGYWE